MHSKSLRLLAALAFLVALVFGAAGSVAEPAGAAGSPPYPAKLTVKSELRLKANLVRDHLSKSPQLVFFGGSRSQRFDPVYARRVTGLRSVNITTSNARPEAAWAMLNWFYQRWPDAKIRWVWGVQSSMLRDRDLDPALLQDPRFYPYFPDDLLGPQRAKLPDSVAEMPRTYGFLRNTYSSLGLLVRNIYDERFALGYTLDASLDAYIARMLRDAKGITDEPSRAQAYFEKTVKLLNEHGTTPVMVLMPIHPRVLRVMREHHLGGAREELRDYFAEFSERADIQVLDLTNIKSFYGRPDWFYDGVHITRGNANRVIKTVTRKAGDCLK